MKKRIALGPILGGLLVALLPAAAGGSGNVSVSTPENGDVTSCRDFRIRFDDREGERDEETFTVAKGPLQANLPSHSGIWVVGSDRQEFSVTACKAGRTRKAMERLSVSSEAGRVTVEGAHEDALVYLIVRAPRGGALDLEARNGPISFSGASGTLRARNINGPISFERCSGDIDAHTENGPISFKNGSGDVRARAVNGPIDFSGREGELRLNTENGPLSVALDGDRWGAGSLEAHAVNGPLHLEIPENYRSGVRVDISGHSPVSCPRSACARARRSWDDRDRSIEFGDADPVVRMSTVNGPVSIATRD